MARLGRKYSRLPRNPSGAHPGFHRTSSASSFSAASAISMTSTPANAGVSGSGESGAVGPVPISPPPSFRSVASYMPIQPDDPLARSFDMPAGDDDNDDGDDDFFFRRSDTAHAGVSSRAAKARSQEEGVRLLPAEPTNDNNTTAESIESEQAPTSSQSTSPSTSSSVASSSHHIHAPANSNDGVFANIMAKPEAGEKPSEENPPSYEEAAADATPPYWETTIIAPGMSSDEVFIDGLPVGNFFNFVWNMLISMSFQFVGFLLTYLLHTTHAAKNGSRAGLGITLIQYGFYIRSAPEEDTGVGSGANSAAVAASAASDPNSYNVQTATGNGTNTSSGSQASTGSEWFSYFLMLLGWFILLKSMANFFRARRMEQVILRGPEPSNNSNTADVQSPENAV
ncbi:hypothetical protein POJ06DRAFT_254875 [Lipomyces tetrasporus]|uniref:Metal homeostatis protein bsd2 n=1 Tax=Lipomyces tetrasporus TaxID=54092 RepID=A0AAD7QRJ6_9ASCO|nr:uncharacterized protein POJ06DRAFT_254875 [Lipomyces tetrasporus]KAJ8099916.1 hypothetical protein POJ06DRAFT_254875 [Lipomyces tetrasporus]